ncbi:WD domain protein [Aspergillus clavatus NRRL 1]|uniref:DNA damage-binding protein cmr1 n=1 Tax=Aspergillus clavatus (strain ATCC 1007 / CBS 513.65 / DSM 816 / NCTC 3887 / NRRL 1 / QM 1276 / 107) TaxID=344612 RepID=CMR1_ASPCL|nr:WD domain protein [Aspergillus clavatus NRRL 1]A1CU75.1 RecName: Full=DNA damage-binding protein cmr1 [Aspergillus clavatus NRRL 1]EAW06862.1 WD domain protein [Aspergillus clavatus NRRL 1]
MGTDSTELSEFEKQRLANIAERDALLKKLTLDAQSSGIFPPKLARSSPVSQTKPKKKPAPKKIKKEGEAPVARRMSSRLRGIAAESEVAKRKAEEHYEAVQQAERAKRVRKSDAFSFSEMLVSGQKLSADGLIGVDVVTKGVAMPYQRTFGDEDIEKTADKELKRLREEVSGLQLWEAWEPNRIKVTPERIYTMTFHPSEAKPLIFAGDKMGNLGVLDASQERPVSSIKHEDGDEEEQEDDDDPDPVLTTLKPHTRTISSMHIHPSKPTHLYTASYDSSIRELDLEKTTSVETYAPDSPSDDVPISGIDMAADDPNTLYWTTLDGAFGRYDTRASRRTAVATWQLSEKKIGGFSLYPTHPHFFATASLDRTMRLWDLRKLSHDDPLPVGEHLSRLSVSHAAFNSAGQVATSSYDDSLKIYDFGAKGIASWEQGHTLSDAEMKPDTVVRHNCQTGRWVTILRPQWQANPQSHIQRFCIGNMNRFVDVYSSSGDQLAQLGGDGITAVPAVAVFHRSKNWIAGGTASGKICLWM